MPALIEPQSPTLPSSPDPTLGTAEQRSHFTATWGFQLDVLPIVALTGTIAAAGNFVAPITLPDASTWYSLTIEVIARKAVGPTYYVYRQVVEAYRAAAGGAVIHFQPAARPVESPIGGDYSVVVAAVGNEIRATLSNAAATAITYTVMMGYTRKPLP